MIRLLWPTVRPEIMKKTYKHWIDTAAKPDRINIKIAVNTKEHRDQLTEFDVMVIGNERRGPVYATSRKIRKRERNDETKRLDC